jgi:Flp pilus assembly protein TadG
MSAARPARRGVAATELAILLPFLAYLFVIGVDWSRVFYYSITIDNCARNGAIYASDPYTKVQSPYGSITAAALADASNLSPAPTVTSASGVDANGYNYVDCTVSWAFHTITKFPGVPQQTTLARTVRVYQAPSIPR